MPRTSTGNSKSGSATISILIPTLLLLVWACCCISNTSSFMIPTHRHHHATSERSFSSALLKLEAKKKKRSSGGKGFANKEEEESPVAAKSPSSSAKPSFPSTGGGNDYLSSLAGGSADIPTLDDSGTSSGDSNLPVDERTSAILRDQYGFRTLAEQQEELKRQEAAKEQRKKLEEWKKLADDGKDFDIMEVLPGPVLMGIDRFLKAGVAICTVLFLLAGIGITIEAWSKTSSQPLPENIDNFIVNVIEPNFTPGLGVLLGFSVSLGAFAAAQLSSSSSTYRQDR
eukprot:scaffold3267_cov140-Cylindrotheca_fusiformis.AAC.8